LRVYLLAEEEGVTSFPSFTTPPFTNVDSPARLLRPPVPHN
jgi:hypothetical protein